MIRQKMIDNISKFVQEKCYDELPPLVPLLKQNDLASAEPEKVTQLQSISNRWLENTRAQLPKQNPNYINQ